jgi:hypothetical protein
MPSRTRHSFQGCYKLLHAQVTGSDLHMPTTIWIHGGPTALVCFAFNAVAGTRHLVEIISFADRINKLAFTIFTSNLSLSELKGNYVIMIFQETSNLVIVTSILIHGIILFPKFDHLETPLVPDFSAVRC